MLRTCALALAVGFVAQCAAPARTGQRVSSLGEIQGAWDIVSFNGHEPQRLDGDGHRHAFVDITADGGFSFTIGCNFSGMTGRIDENGHLLETSTDSIVTAMGCGQLRERRDERFFAFFRSRPTIARTDQEVSFVSDQGRLILQRPDVRRASALPTSLDQLQGRWMARIIYFDIEPGHNRNLIAPLEEGVARFELTGDQAQLLFDCERVVAHARLGGAGRVQFTSLRRETTPPCRIGEADRDLAIRLLAAETGLEWINLQRIHLVSGQVRAVLDQSESAEREAAHQSASQGRASSFSQ